MNKLNLVFVFSAFFILNGCVGSEPSDNVNPPGDGDADSDGDTDGDSDSDADGDADNGPHVTNGVEYCEAIAAAYEQALDECQGCEVLSSSDRQWMMESRSNGCLRQFQNPRIGYDWGVVSECLRLFLDSYDACQNGPYINPYIQTEDMPCSPNAATFGLQVEGDYCEGSQECAEGLTCDYGLNVCGLLPDPIGAGGACISGQSCVDGYHCDGTRCVSDLPEGSRCGVDSDCQIDLACLERDQALYCTRIRFHLPDGSICEYDSECDSGLCVFECDSELCEIATGHCTHEPAPICG